MVAEALGIHESTVSRSTASVLIQTPRGTFPLKMFFSSGLQASENDEGVSARSIRRKIKDIIASEDPLKPISDAKISDLLKGWVYRRASDCCKVQRAGKPQVNGRSQTRV